MRGFTEPNSEEALCAAENDPDYLNAEVMCEVSSRGCACAEMAQTSATKSQCPAHLPQVYSSHRWSPSSSSSSSSGGGHVAKSIATAHQHHHKHQCHVAPSLSPWNGQRLSSLCAPVLGVRAPRGRVVGSAQHRRGQLREIPAPTSSDFLGFSGHLLRTSRGLRARDEDLARASSALPADTSLYPSHGTGRAPPATAKSAGTRPGRRDPRSANLGQHVATAT